MIDGPVRQFGWLVNDWQRFNASCVNIRRLLTATPHVKNTKAAREGAVPDSMRGDIRFDHVDFAFPDDPDTLILHDIDFHAPAGSRLGILGETGAGKSTLVNLIARFYDPTSGTVTIDGIDAKRWPLKQLRSQVAIVAQDVFLFSDTIEGNIGFGASDEPRFRAAYGADCRGRRLHSPHAGRLPDGGRRTRRRAFGRSEAALGLARALADDPAILIMDDTTSAVDMETEAQIQQHLKDLDDRKTIVTIAHRISSVKDCDLILVLEHGRIAERGTYDELIARHGLYEHIYEK